MPYYIIIMRLAIEHLRMYDDPEDTLRLLRDEPEELVIPDLKHRGVYDDTVVAWVEQAKSLVDQDVDGTEALAEKGLVLQYSRGFRKPVNPPEDLLLAWWLTYWAQKAVKGKVFDLANGFGDGHKDEIRFAEKLLKVVNFQWTLNRTPIRDKTNPNMDRLALWMSHQGPKYLHRTMPFHHRELVDWLRAMDVHVVTYMPKQPKGPRNRY